MRTAILLAAVLLTAGLAGCIGQADEGSDAQTLEAQGQDDTASVAEAAGPQAVVALVDTGINPYHVAFRDDSQLAETHPSEYLPGYPEGAKALNLTLDAESLDEALEADADVWSEAEPGQLYWIPGTKIVGAYATSDGDPVIFSAGHGTMTASRAAGNQYSLCGDCRIAAVQGFSAEAVAWAADQPWIDAQSNSWSPIVVFQQADPVQSPGLTETFEEAAQEQLVFGSAGNGVMGKLGVAGHPSFTRSTSGPEGVVSVGGHDNGQVILWSGSMPHVATDACDNLAPVGDTLGEYGPEGGGTSSASPYAAGAAARLVLEARQLLDDPYDVGRSEDGVLARGTGTEAMGEVLADGQFTVEEAKQVLFHTAEPRPTESEHDGEVCTTGAPYNTYPIEWQAIPEDVPAYYFIGWGGVSPTSLSLGLDVLSGAEELPERPQASQQHATAQELREVYRQLP